MVEDWDLALGWRPALTWDLLAWAGDHLVEAGKTILAQEADPLDQQEGREAGQTSSQPGV